MFFSTFLYVYLLIKLKMNKMTEKEGFYEAENKDSKIFKQVPRKLKNNAGENGNRKTKACFKERLAGRLKQK